MNRQQRNMKLKTKGKRMIGVLSVATGITSLALGILLVVTERKRSRITEEKILEIRTHLDKQYWDHCRDIEAVYRDMDEVIMEQVDAINERISRADNERGLRERDDGNDSGYESE